MQYAVFQRAYARSDPRTVLIFTAQYPEVLPYIVSQAVDLSAQLQLVDDNVCDDSDQFLSLVDEAFDAGRWLVVPDLTAVDFADWRVVGQKLAVAQPSAKHRLRAQFRLWAFLPEGTTLPMAVPPILRQTALVIDRVGNVTSRGGEPSPLFSADAAGGAGVDDAASGGTAAGAVDAWQRNLRNDRSDPFAPLVAVRAQLWGDGARTAATDPRYVDETLCPLRDQLLLEQRVIFGDATGGSVTSPSAAAAALAAANGLPLEAAKNDCGAASDAASVAAAKAASDENFEWIHHRILAWVVEHCPDADISALPDIPEDKLETTTVVWQNNREVCEAGLWDGCPVLVKRKATSLIESYSEAAARSFASEAGRHYGLRHPHVVAIYGMSDGRAVLEPGPGTLEQALIRARQEARRWTVRRFLGVAQHVLRALRYLGSAVVHRDVACRSVLEASDGKWKVGQFACAVPLQYTKAEADAGLVPVRWTAPEGLSGEFTPKSDVWSLGVLLWEAVHYATATPFEEHELPAPAILRGERLACPPECPREFYDAIIAPCLTADAVERPDASVVQLAVEKALGFWSADLLDGVVPFPTDQETFESFNEKVRRDQTQQQARQARKSVV